MCSISASYSLPWAMAFSKIEGLEVMPFNPSSSIRRLNSAPARNSRLRKSSQMDWPSCSSCLRRFMPRSSSESEGIDTMRLGDTRLAPRRMAASLLGTLLERDGKGSGSAPILRHRPVGGGNVSICLYQSRQFLPPPTRVGWGERRTPSAPHPEPCSLCSQRSDLPALGEVIASVTGAGEPIARASQPSLRRVGELADLAGVGDGAARAGIVSEHLEVLDLVLGHGGHCKIGIAKICGVTVDAATDRAHAPGLAQDAGMLGGKLNREFRIERPHGLDGKLGPPLEAVLEAQDAALQRVHFLDAQRGGEP